MSHQFKVVFTDFDYPSIDIELKQLEQLNAQIITYQCKSEKELIKITRDADGIICQYTPITVNVINSLQKCKVISRYGAGVDNIDVKAATERGIAVAYVPDYCIDEVSNHTIALIMSLARGISAYDVSTRNDIWDYKASEPIYSFSGQTIGIFGLGRIGLAVAKKLQNLNIKILSNDPYVEKNYSRDKDGKFSGIG